VRKTIILEDICTAKRAAQHRPGKKEVKVWAGVWMWSSEESCSDDGRVGAAAMGKYGDTWKAGLSYRGAGRLPVFDAELLAIEVVLVETVMRRDR